jgi:hypothetical protein
MFGPSQLTAHSHTQVATTGRALGWAFVVVAGLVFLLRGPARTLRSGDDFAPAYAAARTWLLGENPYDGATLTRVLFAAGRGSDQHSRGSEGGALYAPATFVILAPFALLSWQAARATFLLASCVLFVWHLKPILRLAALSLRDTEGVWLLGGVLALAPYHTGIALGQTAIPCVALLVLGIDAIQQGDDRRGGVMLAFATLLKPQLAAPFILYLFLRHRPRPAATALGIGVAAMIVGVAWLSLHQVPWLEGWIAAARDVSAFGPEHDPVGPFSPQMLELRPLIAALTGMPWVGALGFALAAAGGVVLYVWGRSLSKRRDLLLMSAVAVLTLLAVYHRFYDAAILCLPLAWAASTYAHEMSLRRVAIAAAACCAIFFAPGAWMFQRLVNDGTVSAERAHSFFWNVILLRHQNWALVALFAALWTAISKSRREDEHQTTSSVAVAGAP